MNSLSHTHTHNKAFTLIELLVVIVIIGILATISVSTFQGYFAKARDAQRASDISMVNKAIQLYYTVHEKYPITGGLSNVYLDPNCGPDAHTSDLITENWVPDLVSEGFIGELPQDPLGKDWTGKKSCYMYSSDGEKYILSAWGTLETGPQTSIFYSRAGYRESSRGLNLSPYNAIYLCNHYDVGISTVDHYKHSYTITNVDCTW